MIYVVVAHKPPVLSDLGYRKLSTTEDFNAIDELETAEAPESATEPFREDEAD